MMRFDRLEIWYTNTADWQYRAALAECVGDLSYDEKAKLERFLFEPDKLRYLIGKALVKRVLSHHRRDVSPEKWQFSIGEFGKPHVRKEQFGSPVHVNLSHSEQLIACTMSRIGRVGVDVEKVKPLGDLDGMAKRFFSGHEYALVASAEGCGKLDVFYTLWTLKESFIKAVGDGLSMPLNDFWFDFHDDGSLGFHIEPTLQTDPELWRFWSFKPLSGDYRMAVALNCERSDAVTLRATNFIELSEVKDEPLQPVFSTSNYRRFCNRSTACSHAP